MNKKTKYNRARNIVLVVAAVTVLNIVMVALGMDTMFLFSASIPFYSTYITLMYADIFWAVIALVSLFALLGCWILSKERIIGLVLAIIYFIIDALYLLWLVDFEIGLIVGELIFHAIIIADIVYAICLFPKQKSMEEELLGETAERINHAPIGHAEDVKARIFLEDDILGRHVVYRRVKSVNQLVIDGNVYDEYKAVVEMPHELKAQIDDHIYEAGGDTSSMMYLALDGERVKIKRRLI